MCVEPYKYVVMAISEKGGYEFGGEQRGVCKSVLGTKGSRKYHFNLKIK